MEETAPKEIKIKKAKVKSGMFLQYGYTERTLEALNSISTESDAPIHPDLKNAFEALVPHFAALTEEIELETAREVMDLNQTLEGYLISGFQLQGNGDGEGVTLSGAKILSNGKKVSFSTPPQNYFDDGENAYPYGRQLKIDMDRVINEVEMYMNGKQAEPPMGSLFDGFDDDEIMEDDE